MEINMLEKVKRKLRQTCTAQTLYDTMHVSHIGYRHKNQGIATVCDWLHLLQDNRGIVHDPWACTPITIIELGCGNGNLCNFLRSLNFDVEGMDIFDNKVIYDRSWYRFKKHDLAETPYSFENDEFDYCLSFDVMEHLEEKYIAPVLQEMARISSNGIIAKVSCSGEAPLHLTIKSPGWWFDQLTENCPDFSWQLVRNYERIVKDGDPIMKPQNTFSTARPVPDGYAQIFAPMFFGKRGAVSDED